jgi:hypothetical protein
MNRIVRRFVRATLAMLIGTAALLFPVVASADSTSLQPQSGELVAKGVEVDVNVTFTCPAGDTVANPFGMGGGLNVSVQQAVSKTRQASGFGSSDEVCTGSAQTAVVPVLADVSGPPFRVGSAVAFAFLAACDASFNCVSASSAPTTIRISN